MLGTLFNPEYLNLGLLEYGWIPALGTSPVWSGYVLTIHTVWSMLVPIVLTEQLFRTRAHRHLLRTPGTVAAVLGFLLGAAVVGIGNYVTYGFFPSTVQGVGVLALIGATVVAGLLLRPSAGPGLPGSALSPRSTALLTAICSALFVFSQDPVGIGWSVPPAVTRAVMAVAAATEAVSIGLLARREGWTERHSLAAATGAMVTYCWNGFLVQFSIHGFTAAGLAAQLVFVALALALLIGAWRRQAAARPA